MDENIIFWRRGILAGEIQEFRDQYYQNVFPYFESKNKERGNAAFRSWEKRFLLFLENNLPSKDDDYRAHLRESRQQESPFQTVLEN